MAGNMINDFRVGIQLSDDKSRNQVGIMRYTNFVSESPRWSDWATDTNKYDPDAARLHLERKGGSKVESVDIRFAIQASDKAGLSQFGIVRYTPWASEIGVSAYQCSGQREFESGHWSDFAFDENQY